MAQTTPPVPTAAPTPAIQRGDRATFADRVDAAITYLTAGPANIYALALNAYNNCVDALASAVSAASSAATATAAASAALSGINAVPWVSGTTYAVYDVRISPINKRAYRRLTAGAGTTDPSLDPTNWLDPLADEPGLTFLDKGNSGTTAQAFNYLAAEVQQLTVTGAFNLSVTNLPSTRAAIMRLDLVNGGAHTIFWGTTINWEKADGTFTTNFALSGYTFLSSGKNFVMLWTSVPGGPLYGRVV